MPPISTIIFLSRRRVFTKFLMNFLQKLYEIVKNFFEILWKFLMKVLEISYVFLQTSYEHLTNF
jgi:hypothetical protein